MGKIKEKVRVKIVTDATEGIEISELDHESVNEVFIGLNHAERLLFVPGMILEGGKQTRSATRPFIIDQITYSLFQLEKWSNPTQRNSWIFRMCLLTYIMYVRNATHDFIFDDGIEGLSHDI